MWRRQKDRPNLERLAGALRELGARLRGSGDPDAVPFPVDAGMLGSAEPWTLTTSAGDLAVCFTPAGLAATTTSGERRRASGWAGA